MEFCSEMNQKFDEIIEESALNLDTTFSIPLSATEIAEVIQRLPNGKSPGHDGITYEHMKYGGEVISQVLLEFYMMIIKTEEIPKSFKLAIKIPILKVNKNTRTFDNHRGISLLTCLNKVFERIVLSRLQKEPKNAHNFLQGGYQKEQDALTTCFVINEAINHCCEENEKVYVAYMDISKAFDTMWINAMLYKLRVNKNISGKVWRLIRNWYSSMNEFVFIGGSISRTYELHQGTRQGGVLSPWLFLIFIDDLIEELNRTDVGISINSIYCGSPMFADDLTMLSRVKSGLDIMLQAAWDFSRRWRFNFNLTKTVVLTFGESPMEYNINCERRIWKLGTSVISEMQVWSNLGKTWHTDNDSSLFVSKAIEKARDACFLLVGMGARYGGINPSISSKLWKIVGLPKLLYGSELWQLKSRHITELEKLQNITVRIMQGLLPGTSGSAACGLLGLFSVEVEIDKHKLYFLGRIISMSPGTLIRRMFFIRLIRWKWNLDKRLTGFIPDVIKVLKKYDLLEYMIEFILRNQFPKKNAWKRIVNSQLRSWYQEMWQHKITSNRQLSIYARVHPIHETCHWWLLAKEKPEYLSQITDVLRVISGSYKVRGKRVNNPNEYTDFCDLCERNYLNPVKHAFLYCNGSNRQRERFWSWINDTLPISMSVYLASLSDTDFLFCIFGEKLDIICSDMTAWSAFLLESACFISSCFNYTIISI